MAEQEAPKPELSQSKSLGKIRPERSCRDMLFLLIFLAFWLGMFYVGGYGFGKGDPRILIYGLDYKGNLCDKEGGAMEGFPYRYWPNFNEVWDAGSSGNPFVLQDAISLCLKKCPQPSDEKLTWVCKYPQDGHPNNQTTLQEWHDMDYDYFNELGSEAQATSYKMEGPCYPVLLPSVAEYWSCQYFGALANVSSEWSKESDTELKDDSDGGISKAINNLLTQPMAIINRYIADLGNAWLVLLVCGLALSFVASFVWLVLMRYFSGIMAWFTVLIVNVFAWAVLLFSYMKAGIIADDALNAYIGSDNIQKFESFSGASLDASSDNKDVMVVMSIIATVLTVLLLLFTAVMIPRIYLAVAVLKVACQAVAYVPTVLFTPVLPFLAIVAVSVYWLGAALYLFSAGDITQRDCENTEYGDECGYEVSWNMALKYMLLYHFFGLLWTLQFIIAFTYTSIAGAVANFYWTRGQVNALEQSPVLGAMWRTTRYHLGSLAIGSFITALFQFIRFIVKYIEHQCKKLKDNNEMVRFIFCCVNCCLWYMQTVVNFINRNAYIVVAIDGTNFCTSARRACNLILENILRVAAVNVIGDSILFLGKLSVALGCTFVTYIYLEGGTFVDGANKISSPLLVITAVMVISFAIASAFMAVVEMAVDTVLLSYCIDTEENNGEAKYAPELLISALEKARRDEEKAKERREAKKQKQLEEKASQMVAAASENNARLQMERGNAPNANNL